jgi:hypothetical protein
MTATVVDLFGVGPVAGFSARVASGDPALRNCQSVELHSARALHRRNPAADVITVNLPGRSPDGLTCDFEFFCLLARSDCAAFLQMCQ